MTIAATILFLYVGRAKIPHEVNRCAEPGANVRRPKGKNVRLVNQRLNCRDADTTLKNAN